VLRCSTDASLKLIAYFSPVSRFSCSSDPDKTRDTRFGVCLHVSRKLESVQGVWTSKGFLLSQTALRMGINIWIWTELCDRFQQWLSFLGVVHINDTCCIFRVRKEEKVTAEEMHKKYYTLPTFTTFLEPRRTVFSAWNGRRCETVAHWTLLYYSTNRCNDCDRWNDHLDWAMKEVVNIIAARFKIWAWLLNVIITAVQVYMKNTWDLWLGNV